MIVNTEHRQYATAVKKYEANVKAIAALKRAGKDYQHLRDEQTMLGPEITRLRSIINAHTYAINN